ncbi:MAG: hypothetical protein QF685_03010 [Verrucomicrobiota bacterium]|jgi:hypothetical protein|nr:hypothetical protein [Verrucomicrobiota bacterium]
MGTSHFSASFSRRGMAVVDALLMLVAALALLVLVLFEFFHVRTMDRVLQEEDSCVRKNLTALNQAMDVVRLNRSGDTTAPIALIDLQTNVIHFAGCVVEVEGQGLGEVTHPHRDEQGKVAGDGTVKVRLFKGGSEMKFRVDNFKCHLACPAGGTYSVDRANGLPRCSVFGHALGN